MHDIEFVVPSTLSNSINTKYKFTKIISEFNVVLIVIHSVEVVTVYIVSSSRIFHLRTSFFFISR